MATRKIKHPLFADMRTAAKLLCMKPAEFAQLVREGALPGPVNFDRWDVEELAAIMRGDSIVVGGELEL